MSEDGDLWRNHRKTQQERRAHRLPHRTIQILSLSKEGYWVKQLSAYQFRINGVLDVYPIHNRWHDTKTGQRGGYADAKTFIRNFFKT